jgi:hypothetical protein
MFRGGHMEYRASGPLLQLYHVTYQVTLAHDLAIDTMFINLGHIIIIIASSGLAIQRLSPSASPPVFSFSQTSLC